MTKDIKTEEIKERRLSPSSINTWFKCPRGFYYQYIKKSKTKPSIHLVKGIIVHEVLEYFYRKYQEDLHTHLFQLLKEKWTKYETNLKQLEMSDEEFEKHVFEGLKRCNEEMEIGLKDEELIKTLYYRSITSDV